MWIVNVQLLRVFIINKPADVFKVNVNMAFVFKIRDSYGFDGNSSVVILIIKQLSVKMKQIPFIGKYLNKREANSHVPNNILHADEPIRLLEIVSHFLYLRVFKIP